ncbi:MAG: hypothetical protein KDD82_22840 [Planctomycetes bacterium]|nr:hypothetical protein [Planctomycetota bacterium]
MRKTTRLLRQEVESIVELETHLARKGTLAGAVIQGLDVSHVPSLYEADLTGTVFLGCTFRDLAQEREFSDRGAAVFPALSGLPYKVYRKRLYTVDELLEGYAEGGYRGTLDFAIYTHYDRARRVPSGPDPRESLAQHLHDYGIDDALAELLEKRSGNGVVGIMGGHSTGRGDPYYAKVARLAWELTRAGYLIASGGGPGIMEAANLGAWLAPYADPAVIDAALEVLRPADRFSGGHAEGTPEYLAAIQRFFACAQQVVARFAQPGDADRKRFGRAPRGGPGASLAIPTWFYGHEPTNLFGSWVAKYFSNSLREDGLLAIATAGVVYAPGSAGTLQELFVDLAQNHYGTFRLRSPMVFLGRETYGTLLEWVRGFVERTGKQTVYGDLIALVEEPLEAAAFIRANPPRPAPAGTPLYEL